MVSLTVIRLSFLIISMFMGYIFSYSTPFFANGDPFYYVLGGFIIGLLIIIFEVTARQISLKGLSSAVFGILLGIILAKLFSFLIFIFPVEQELSTNISIVIYLICIYFGLTLGLKGKEEFNLIIPYVRFRRSELHEEKIVVDTSSIIDGRILDIVKTGFLEAKLIISRAVLHELQALADSTDIMKRQKGKRGIEILHQLKKQPNIEVEIYEDVLDNKTDVDEYLVHLAKLLDAKIITTDYNLNRIAQLQGVKVLNVNDLNNALKPILLPGERINIRIIKEGKEHNQGIGYLDDGTMVVVENGRWLIGKTVDLEVTSVLQSPSGRIIFTKPVGR